jgi:TB domain
MIDTRKLNCYNQFRNGSCQLPRDSRMSRAQCCCSRGAAWGTEPCEVCPEPHESESLNHTFQLNDQVLQFQVTEN